MTVKAMTIKSPYAAPDSRRTRIRPLAPASAHRRPVMTWKDRAQAALGVPMETQNAIVIVEVPFSEARTREANSPRPAIRINWQLWQVIAPVIITVCAIAQLANCMR